MDVDAATTTDPNPDPRRVDELWFEDGNIFTLISRVQVQQIRFLNRTAAFRFGHTAPVWAFTWEGLVHVVERVQGGKHLREGRIRAHGNAGHHFILQAGNTQYRVFRSTLARRSTVFKDMFSFPQPADAELVDGCPLVRLPDADVDATPFLRALFDPEFFLPFPEPTTFDAMHGCLRLAHKYEVPELRRRALVHLSSKFRTTLAQKDGVRHFASAWQRKTSLTDIYSWDYLGTMRGAEYLHVVARLAAEVGALWILPSVFFSLAADIYPETDAVLLKGTKYAGQRICLSTEDQVRILQGRREQTRCSSSIMHQFQEPDPQCQTSASCNTGRMEIFCNNQDMFPTYILDPFLIWTNNDWEDHRDSLCKICQRTIEHRIKEIMQHFWDHLPQLYGLPDWDVLEKMKVAAIGDCFLKESS
ncbi:BTB domain-containing protein [Mycena chlorophos]|uniref:BTB domain-containing protein n=1 Tax=Mycena chlorophos TaxID=658473 RepID=A0A8H6TT55_MYCCL|nr:BTB domain-containing protein [Mycena chlorophos]